MNIFYAAANSPSPYFKSNIWRNNLYSPLVDLGYDVVEFDYDMLNTFRNANPEIKEQKDFISKNRPILSEHLLSQIKKVHSIKPIDVFFSYFYDACIFPEVINEIKKLGIITINWFCNASYQFNLVKEISPYYDYCLVPEKFRLSDYKNIGANPIYFQEAANPNIYKYLNIPYKYDLTFVGQAYGERPNIIKNIIDNEIDIHVYGYGWKLLSDNFIIRKTTKINNFVQTFLLDNNIKSLLKRYLKLKCTKQLINDSSKKNQKTFLPNKNLNGILKDNDIIKVFNRSKVNLGLSSVANTNLNEERILQIRLRDFEIPMSGGFYLVEFQDDFEEFFKIGKEIVCYENIDDLIEKTKYYLKNESEREKIRLAGYNRAQREHTWQNRFKKLFSEVIKVKNA